MSELMNYDHGRRHMALQKRYPTLRDGDEVYVLRERMTHLERQENIKRLRAAGELKLAHAEALEKETEELLRSGAIARNDRTVVPLEDRIYPLAQVMDAYGLDSEDLSNVLELAALSESVLLVKNGDDEIPSLRHDDMQTLLIFVDSLRQESDQ